MQTIADFERCQQVIVEAQGGTGVIVETKASPTAAPPLGASGARKPLLLTGVLLMVMMCF